jgi:lipoprotein-anchoring transpeptidase ErfK/SrfK
MKFPSVAAGLLALCSTALLAPDARADFVLRPPGAVPIAGGAPYDPRDVTGSVQPGGPAAMQPQGSAQVPGRFRRQMVSYWGREAPGTIIVDTDNTTLLLVQGNGQAISYGVGVGRDGFRWSGEQVVTRMSAWPDWNPPSEMIERQPYLPRFMAGGPSNPMGARALYLGNSVYRIHGTNDPSTIGQFVSSGCIRLLNDDIEDLYARVGVGTKVIVLPSARNYPAS